MSPQRAAPPVRKPYKARSKYGAVATTVDGHRFHSAAEARRFSELKLLEKAGEIRELKLQPRFSLCVMYRIGEPVIEIGVYVADFRYQTSHGALVVEDVKGMATPLYRWKKKHVEAQYGITVVEIRGRG